SHLYSLRSPPWSTLFPTRRSSDLLCFRQQPDHPRTVVAVDLTDGSIETLVDLNPEFRRLRLGEVELFEWTNAKDYGTFGYLVTPDRKSTRLNSSHVKISYAVFCLK